MTNEVYVGRAKNSLDAMYKCIEHLRHAYTSEGVTDWFDRPRYELDGRTPLNAINNGEYEKVILMAEGARSSDAT